MNKHNALRALLASARRFAESHAKREAWVDETGAALVAAQRHMDERCDEAVGRLSEEEFERLFNEEQAKVDLFLAPLTAAAERDRWPKHLYFGGI
jgi:hypothetical protein